MSARDNEQLATVWRPAETFMRHSVLALLVTKGGSRSSFNSVAARGCLSPGANTLLPPPPPQSDLQLTVLWLGPKLLYSATPLVFNSPDGGVP